jgi:hypothetical protein
MAVLRDEWDESKINGIQRIAYFGRKELNKVTSQRKWKQ